MITVTNVEIRQTKTGKDYKALTINGTERVNMWNNDPDYENTNTGTELDREIIPDGQYKKLSDKQKQVSENVERPTHDPFLEKKVLTREEEILVMQANSHMGQDYPIPTKEMEDAHSNVIRDEDGNALNIPF